MIIIMKQGASQKEVQAVSDRIESLGFKSHVIVGEELTIVAAVGDKRLPEPQTILNHGRCRKSHSRDEAVQAV